MEFIALYPPRTGALVWYPGDAQVKEGVYRVVDTDEYNMTEEITVGDSKGRTVVRSARSMDLLEISQEFLSFKPRENEDGVTFLPPKKELRNFGFTDHRPGYWYYCAKVADRVTFNVIVRKEPVGDVKGEPVYGYVELLHNEDSGEPAYFGSMEVQYRFAIAKYISAELSKLIALGLQIHLDPREYAWKNWPEGKPLQGIHRDSVLMAHLENSQDL